jgi:hypothetical protein
MPASGCGEREASSDSARTVVDGFSPELE